MLSSRRLQQNCQTLESPAVCGCGTLQEIVNLSSVLPPGGFNTDVEDYQTLLSLARSQGAVGGQNRGACKICGQLGHLTKQCRNHLSAHFQMPGRADGTAAAANGKPLMPTLPTVGGEEEDLSSDLSDLDSSSSDSGSSSESEGERRKRKVCYLITIQHLLCCTAMYTVLSFSGCPVLACLWPRPCCVESYNEQ